MKLSESQAEAIKLMVTANEPNAVIYGVIFGAANHGHDPTEYYNRYRETRDEIDAYTMNILRR